MNQNKNQIPNNQSSWRDGYTIQKCASIQSPTDRKELDMNPRLHATIMHGVESDSRSNIGPAICSSERCRRQASAALVALAISPPAQARKLLKLQLIRGSAVVRWSGSPNISSDASVNNTLIGNGSAASSSCWCTADSPPRAFPEHTSSGLPCGPHRSVAPTHLTATRFA